MSRNHRALSGPRWRRLRRRILERDSFRCRKCRRWGGEVDHIVPLARGGARYDPENLQTLCSGCHIRKTRGENRSETPAARKWRAVIEGIAVGR